MGLLKKGKTLNWENSKQYIEYIKEHGVIQFLNVYNANVKKQVDSFKFGDEVNLKISNHRLNTC